VGEVHKNLVGIPEEKKQLGTSRRRWEDNIKRILILGWDNGMD
jgi:hypothetical protein